VLQDYAPASDEAGSPKDESEVRCNYDSVQAGEWMMRRGGGSSAFSEHILCE
jgi:hypothetical protein